MFSRPVHNAKARLLVGGVLFGTWASCTPMTLSVAPPVTPAMVHAAHGATAEELKEGRRIFAGACTACHNADPVGKYRVAEWRAIIDDDMGARARLDAKARAALLAYISAVAAR